ncbi:MAG: O-antigen ligase domain-containing protein [Alphaproteobacteria bacterium]|nr:MAG: O-antigen ligase domain-containing protein [Alphaproteobacteria bacterium]
MHTFTPRFALVALATLVGLSVLLFGANFPFAQGVVPVFCAITVSLVALQAPLRLADSRHSMLLAGVFVPILLVLAWVAFQLVPLGAGGANIFWSLLKPESSFNTISLAPGQTLTHLTYGAGLMLLALAVHRISGVHAHATLRIVAIVIMLACLYGLIQYALGNAYVLWLPKTSYITSLTGTFINRNTFATLAGLGMLANMALMLQRVGEVSSRLSTRQRFKAFWYLVLRPGWVWLAFAAVCFLALLLTGSRAGITASLCGVMVLMGSLAGMRDPVRLPLLSIMGVFTVFIIFMLAILGAELGQRLLSVSNDAALRQGINAASAQLVGQYWLTGTGLGTYGTAFFTVHTPEFLSQIYRIIDHAHNTYMELSTELGLPAMLLLAIAAVSLISAYLVGLTLRRRAIMWPALGVAILTLVGGHALADFSLSTPAIAIVVITMLMAALAQSLPSAKNETPLRSPTAQRYALWAAAALVLVAASWQSVANYHQFRAGSTLRQLTALQPVGPGPMFVAQRHLMRCLAINPWHPTCHADLAQVHLSLATGYGVTGPRASVGLVYINMAHAKYLDALALSPVNPLAWYRLARIEAFLGNRPKAQEYLVNSLITGPAEPGLAMQRLPLMLQLLPEASPDNADLFTSNILAHWQYLPDQMGIELRKNPSVHARLASLLEDTPATREKWSRYIRKPFPARTPLGENTETR